MFRDKQLIQDEQYRNQLKEMIIKDMRGVFEQIFSELNEFVSVSGKFTNISEDNSVAATALAHSEVVKLAEILHVFFEDYIETTVDASTVRIPTVEEFATTLRDFEWGRAPSKQKNGKKLIGMDVCFVFDCQDYAEISRRWSAQI